MTSNLRWHLCSKDDFPFKRHKVQKACQTCRLKKMRCDGRQPCLRCETQHIKCVYDQNKAAPRTLPQAERSPDTTIKKDVSNSDIRFDHRGLRRISFTNALYDSMRQTNDGSRGYLFQTHLPPLMFDFFNLTSQPHSIWSRFTSLFRQYSRRPTRKTAVDLGSEILKLFDDHNWLYASFIDIQPLIDAWCAAPIFQINPTPMNVAAAAATSSPSTQHILLNAIFALVCHAAFQSLSATHTDIARDLEQYSASFYHEAHHRFLQSAFTSQQKISDHAADLARATILLAHYQCAALCENQAYVTLKMASGFISFVKEAASASEKERLRALSSVLNAWNIWIVFYLHLSEPMLTTSEDPSSTETMMPSPTSSVLASDRAESQQWAASVVDAYTRFLTRLNACRGTQTLSHIQTSLESLESWHNMSLSSGNQKAQTILPMQILALYHHVLVIQVIFSQIPAAALMFGSPLEGDGQGQQTTTDIETMVFEKCDKEAADIVHRIDGLILNYHVPLGDLESLQRRYPIAHNVLYPLCLATSITRIYMKRHPKLASHTSASTGMAATTTGIPFGQQIKDEGTQEKLDVNTSAKINGRTGNPKSVTVMPIYKLKRVLNPICSLMDAANVISTPVDEIMMASIANPAGHQLPQQPHQQGRQMPDVQPSSERYPWPENGSMFEESLVPLQVRMMTYPSSYDYRSRNNIDKEQLEKLSQNKDLRSNSSTAVTATASNSAPIPISRANSIAKVHRSMMLSRSRSVSAPSAAHVTLPVRKRGGSHASPQQHLAAQGVKRHYQSNNLNVFSSDPNLAAKRVRTESIAYAGNGFDGHLLRPPHPVQIQRRISPVHSNANSTSHHHSTQGLATIQQQQQQQQQQHPHDLDSEQHQQAAALQQMYHTDFFFMMHPESAAAAAAVADDEELYLQQRRGMKAAAAAAAAAAGQMQNVPGAGEDDSVQQQQSAPQAQPPSSTPTPTSLAASIVVSSPGSASRAAARVPGSLQNDMIPAKLLPPPKQQRALPLKGGYSGVSYPTTTPVDFSESVMETLHHAHSVEPSFGPTGMVDPSMNLSMTTTAAAAAAVAAVRQNQQQQHQQQPQNQHHQATGGNSGEIMYLFGEDSRSSSQQHHQPQQQQDWIEQQSQPPQQRADKDIRHGRSSWYGRQPQQQPPVSTSPTAWANFAQLYQDHRHYGHQTTRASHSNAPGATAVAAATTGNEATVVDDSFDHDQWIMPDTTKMTEESVMNWH